MNVLFKERRTQNKEIDSEELKSNFLRTKSLSNMSIVVQVSNRTLTHLYEDETMTS